LRRLWETCTSLVEVCGEWWWLCGGVNTNDKNAHFNNVFHVSFIKKSLLKQK
jgi:hypothetical protein